MHFLHVSCCKERKTADALVLAFWNEKRGALPAAPLDSNIAYLLKPLLDSGDFTGKEGEVYIFYPLDEAEKRFILVGLGALENASVETFRRSYASVAKHCLHKKLACLNIVVPHAENFSIQDLSNGITEGLLLPNYVYHEEKSHEKDNHLEVLLQQIVWIGKEKRIVEYSKKAAIICEAVYYARDLTNGSADRITPQYLAQSAKNLTKKHPTLQASILGRKEIEKEKMGLLLAVNRGSALDPAFIIMRYRGRPRSKEHTVIVGKGVTYDTGGLNLKQVVGKMDLMKGDMAGAAACLGIIQAAAKLKLKVNLTVAIPATENCIDAKSYKPGDVYTSFSGRTVEMLNADAEGRLILADALAYAVKKFKPTQLIDLATLTGAIEIALGSEAAGLMSTDDELADALVCAGEATYERLWRMPLFEEYKDRLKSDIADLKNWNGRGAGASIAATFLRMFAGDTIPWAHLDIASTAYLSDARRYSPKYATGFGVRLIVEFLQRQAINP